MMRLYFTLAVQFVVCLCAFAQSDVDTHIAVNEQSDQNTFVLIISNEHYKYEEAVPFAKNDGETFRLYCEKMLGIPEKHIRYTVDATLNDMRMQLGWLQKVMAAYGGEARAIVYYSGHGMPDEEGKHAYLLPTDGSSILPNSGLSTEQLYQELSAMPSAATLVLLDACFSGTRRDGKMLNSSRGVAVKVKQKKSAVGGRMVVFSAAQGTETAYPYNEKQHGLFTYFLLKSLQQKGGHVRLGELSDYVIKQVGRASIVENNKSQTPTVQASSAASNWRNWYFAEHPAGTPNEVAEVRPVQGGIEEHRKELAPKTDEKSEPVAAADFLEIVQEGSNSGPSWGWNNRKTQAAEAISAESLVEHPFGIGSIDKDEAFDTILSKMKRIYGRAKIEKRGDATSIEQSKNNGYNKMVQGMPLKVVFIKGLKGMKGPVQIVLFDVGNDAKSKARMFSHANAVAKQLFNAGFEIAEQDAGDKSSNYIYSKKFQRMSNEVGGLFVLKTQEGYVLWMFTS